MVGNPLPEGCHGKFLWELDSSEEYVDAYLEAAAVPPSDKRLPLFRSINSSKLTTRRFYADLRSGS
jgi:hypothetical protein